MRIGELGDRTGVTAKTIRYYESIGLLPEPGRTPSGYRDYDDSAVTRLEFVRSAQGAGLTLKEIGGVLAVRDSGEPPCDHVKEVLARRVAEVETRIAELEATRRELRRLARRAERLDPADCGEGEICRILGDGDGDGGGPAGSLA